MLAHVVFHLPLPLLDLTDPSFGTILGPSMAPIEGREWLNRNIQAKLSHFTGGFQYSRSSGSTDSTVGQAE